MRLFPVVAILLLATAPTVAQKQKAPVGKSAAPAVAVLPTEAEVNEFLRRMFGYDVSLTWKVEAILPSDSPGVAHVVATIGGQQRPIHLYVLPGGKFAVVGEPIPFGADPFGPVRSTLKARATGASRGATNPLVVLVEFSDLQCPFCRAAQPTIDRLVAEVPEAKLIFQPFPLPMHSWAMLAATHAECARQQKPDAFWEFVDSVYADQANITESNVEAKLESIATSIGLDAIKVATCSKGADISQGIQQSIGVGKSVGVNSTPTLFINGRKISAIADIPYEQLKAMVEFEAAEARKRP